MTHELDECFLLLRNRLKDRIRAHQLSLCLRATMAATSELALIPRRSLDR